MKNKQINSNAVNSSNTITRTIKSLLAVCPICGREFPCNRSYHVYTALTDRCRKYYCSYRCFKQRPNPKTKS